MLGAFLRDLGGAGVGELLGVELVVRVETGAVRGAQLVDEPVPRPRRWFRLPLGDVDRRRLVEAR